MKSDIHNGYQRLCNFKRCISIEKKTKKNNAILGRKAGHILNRFNIFPALPRRTVSTLNLFTTFLLKNFIYYSVCEKYLFTYRIHCLMFLPMECGGSVFGPCFVMHYLSVVSSLQSS